MPVAYTGVFQTQARCQLILLFILRVVWRSELFKWNTTL